VWFPSNIKILDRQTASNVLIERKSFFAALANRARLLSILSIVRLPAKKMPAGVRCAAPAKRDLDDGITAAIDERQ
jgi:hypothetical protein